MEALPGDVRLFLQQHPSLQLIAANKVRCTLTGHELICRLPELQSFTRGKKYQRLTTASSSFDFSSFEPHIVPSTKNPKQLFCKLTLRHINRIPEHIQRHVQGKRYTRALKKYEECKQQGVEFVPACLRNKTKPKDNSGHERSAGRKGNTWEPPFSDSEDSDSGDSMSDLYPAQLFTKKNHENEQDDSFQSDSDEEEMEVEPPQNQNKRQQNGPAKKKFKKHHQKAKHFRKSAAK
ncbi:hypothetical protein XENTR_v10020137 [Xenopus tropicalis]|nr:hypothetical protein XENTR_v10020137 [Xenopus tropicalis]